MNAELLEKMFVALKTATNDILGRLFTPAGLIQPSSALISQMPVEHQEIFKRGCSQFFEGEFLPALINFRLLAGKQDNLHKGFSKIIMWNSASCAISMKDYNTVIELLLPYHEIGNLYGVPLWNLGLALFSVEKTEDAVRAIEAFVSRDTEKVSFRQAKAELVISCLYVRLENDAKAKQHLEKAYIQDSSLVTSQLRDRMPEPNLIKELETANDVTEIILTDDSRRQILELLLPKRPGQDPELSIYLSSDERVLFSKAVEILAEGDAEIALQEIQKLSEKYPNIAQLRSAYSSVLLFKGEFAEARRNFLRMEQAGSKMQGISYWNLACAQARLGDYKGAYQSLKKCSLTEYRTKPQLWTVISMLSSESHATVPQKLDSEQTRLTSGSTNALTNNLPTLTGEARLEILLRLLKPKKLSRMFRPDIGRLPQRDSQGIANALDVAHRSSVEDAIKTLLSLSIQFKDVYTVKAHTAAFLTLSGDLISARKIYSQAMGLRSLDNVSRLNYSFICLQLGDLERAGQMLEGGINTTLAEDYTFWLALAIIRAITRKEDASAAALGALACRGVNRKVVDEVLNAAQIDIPATPPKITTENPMVALASQVISFLENNDITQAISTLQKELISVTDIPEIGENVLEPRFVDIPTGFWEKGEVKSFEAAVQNYRNGNYAQAATILIKLGKWQYKWKHAINLSAACLKSNEPVRARKYSRPRNLKQTPSKLAYNRILAFYKSNDLESAVQFYKLMNHPRELQPLMIAICYTAKPTATNLSILAESLKELHLSVIKPSDQLTLALVYALLMQSNPDLMIARQYLTSLFKEGQKELPAAVEVNSMAQIRSVFDELSTSGEYKEIVAYMTTISETCSRQRQAIDFFSISNRDLEHSIGIEFAARVSLIRALLMLGDKERVVREFDEAETLLKQYSNALAPGFRTKDWLSIAQVAKEGGFYWAANRYCSYGLAVEPENSLLMNFKEPLSSFTQDSELKDIINIVNELDKTIQIIPIKADSNIQALRQHAPLLAKAIDELIQQIRDDREDITLEELCDRINIIARIELPEEAYTVIETSIIGIVRAIGGDETHFQLDIDVFDERIWPRMDDDREGSCLLTLTSRKDLRNCSINDLLSDRNIWQGKLAAGKTEFVRWTFYREDGFAPGSIIDIPLFVNIDDGKVISDSKTNLNITVGSSDITWPEYPAGALSPEDIPGQDLYGRLSLIRKITRSLGKKRSQATFFLQAPRQMGKTSLLNFVRKQTPDHVLPVYVNLEKRWSNHNPKNLWNYLIKRLREVSTGEMLTDFNQDFNDSDLIRETAKICSQLNKEYVLFLLDEFHFLFEVAETPRDVLASFRDFLNIQDNKIALILADRYTRNELEHQCPSEYWAQLSVENVGPLDLSSTKLAIEYPTRGTDVSFQIETINYLHQVTGGYPYHVQRMAQEIRDRMFNGPWLTALPSDVDDVVPTMLYQDSLFTSGLCRPERIDETLHEAIAAFLEWKDSCELIPKILKDEADPSGQETYRWNPEPKKFILHIKNPDQVIIRLCDIGILRADGRDIFSPLLHMWLVKMRNNGLSISKESNATKWQTVLSVDGSTLKAREWQNLDSELIRRSKYRGKPPLKEKSSRPDDWDLLVSEVNSETGFGVFLDSAYRLFIDDRDEKESMKQYPWLYYVYHQTRLVRNFCVHSTKSQAALQAWNNICTRALGENRIAYRPIASYEWRALQVAILRSVYAGIYNAIELAGLPE